MRQIDLILEAAAPALARTAGVDEAGRGPLAGEVFAAAVILDPGHPIKGLDDSKRLTAKRREKLFVEIQERALACCIATASVAEIDQLNILHASLLAMRRAVAGLSTPPARALIDGNRVPPGLSCPAEALVGGDATHPAIAAASILAKVARDQSLQALDACFPQYGFARHKGYPTRAHLEALREHGACPAHRRSFAPVRRALDEAERSRAVG